MKNKKRVDKKRRLIWVVLSVVILIGFGFAEQNQSLEDELNNLTAELSSSGYSWLVDYSVSYPSVEVYEKDGSEKIADFGEISEDGKYKIYLTSLVGEQDTFDLKILGASVDFDYVVDPFADNGSLIQTIADCGDLITENATYVLNQSVNTTNTCFNIMANNVTLDCQGFDINYSQSGFGYGVNITGYNYSTIKECNIYEGSTASSAKHGIYLNNAKNNTIENNNVTVIDSYGGLSAVYLAGSSDQNLLKGNTLFASGAAVSGIYLSNMPRYNSIDNNTIVTKGLEDGCGIRLHIAPLNNLTNNKINTSRERAFIIYFLTYANSNLSIDSSNLAEGKPVNYTFDAENLVFDGVDFTQYGSVIFVYSNNITIRNSNFSDDSLYLLETHNSTIENNLFNTTNSYGLANSYSNNNLINNNTIISYSNPGFYGYYYAYNSNITNNTIETYNSSSSGLWFFYVNSTNVKNNKIITSGGNSYAVYLNSYSSLNYFSGNVINTSTGTNTIGIYLQSGSNSNVFVNNSINTNSSSGYGIYFYIGTDNNTFSRMNINTTAHSIYVADINQNFTITDSIVKTSSATNFGFYIYNRVNGGMWNFTNVTQAGGVPINISWVAGGNGTLNMHWYLDVNVTDNSTGGALVSANVLSWNSSGGLNGNSTTGASGLTRQTLLEYTRNASTTTYFSPYMVNVSLNGYSNFTNDSLNLSGNVWWDAKLRDITLPNITSISPTNETFTSNQTINFTANLTDVGSGLSNATLYIYNQSGLYNSTFYNIVGAPLTASVGIVVYMIEGVYTWFWEVFDVAANFITSQNETTGVGGNYTLTVDISTPNISFVAPTPSDGSTTAGNSIYVNVSADGSAGLGTNISTFVDFDNSLVGWWRMDDLNSSGDVVDYMGCYDNETEILTEEGWKYFAELNDDERVMTLNQETGEKELQLPTERQIYDNTNGEMYRIETEEGELVVSGEHKVYASSEERGEISNLSSYSVIKLPSKSSGFVSLTNLRKACFEDSILRCEILNQTIENIVSSLYDNLSVKSESLVTNILFSDLENSDNLPLESCLDLRMMSNPCCLRNISNLLSTFSSKRNLGFDSCSESGIIFTSCQLSCILQSCSDMSFSQGWESFNYFLEGSSVSKHFQNLPDHNSGALESRLAMTNLTVGNNVIVDFNSHENKNINEVYKDYGLELITDVYSDYLNGEEIYFLDSEGREVKVNSITKIDNYFGKIYDVDVENDVVLVRRWSSPEERERYYNYLEENNLIDNELNEENKKDATNIASMATHILADYDNFNYNRYINFSVDNNSAEDASVASMVMHQSQKLGLSRLPGSNPSSSPDFLINSEDTKVKTLSWGASALNSDNLEIPVPPTAFWSGNSNNGSVVGATQVSNGKMGKGMGFDGDGDYIKTASTTDFSLANITVSVWVYANEVGYGGTHESDTVVQRYSAFPKYGWKIGIDNNGKPVWVYYNSSSCTSDVITSSGASVVGGWHHLVGARNSTNLTLYVDGVQRGMIKTTCADQTISETLLIGKWKVGQLEGDVNGTIDDVMIFNRSLSATEIQALYANTSIKYLEKNFTSLAEGAHTMKAYVQDLAGNVNTTELRTVAVDFTPMNNWNCTGTAIKDWTNTSCWSRGVVPVLNDSVVFNATGVAPCNITNNSVVQDLNSFTVESGYTGSIHFGPMFAVGSWGANAVGTQEWNVTNDINISGGTMYIYGDYLLPVNATNLIYGLYNLTDEGHGQIWHSLNGNITVGSSGKLDGVGLGFPKTVGPGYSFGGSYGASYGGLGGNTVSNYIYGNATAPVSLGSGGFVDNAGSGIKLKSDYLAIYGVINVSGLGASAGNNGASGGSIWLDALNVYISGSISADGGPGGSTTYSGGGGGRIRLSYSILNYTGIISISGGRYSGRDGTLTFTNNTWPADWNLTGNIGLLGGDFGEGEVVNVLGNFNTNGYNLSIYGDCFGNGGGYKAFVCYNTTPDGKGVWINASGNITVSSSSIIDGSGLGFDVQTGPGYYDSSYGTSYGGLGEGSNSNYIYGNETSPESLGSGGYTLDDYGGSAIRLESSGFILLDGVINVSGLGASTGNIGASGGSINLIAEEIFGQGQLLADGGPGGSTTYGGGGGGRIALVSHSSTYFNGTILNKGGLYQASGGTIYINATNSITLTGANISVVGFNGTATGSSEDWGQRINITAPLLTLSGIINASAINQSAAGTSNGTITFNFTNCDSSFVGMTTNPNAIFLTQCTPNVTIISPLNDTFTGNATVNFTANVTSVSGIRNVTLSIYNTTGLYNQTTWDYAQGVFSTVVGIPVLMVEGVYTWFFEVWDWANQFVRTDTSTGEGNYTLTVDVSTPNISFVAPTPSDGSTTAGNSIYVNVSADGSAGISTNISTFVDWDGSLVSWWRMDDLNSSGDVVDYIGCYDNETEILTEEGWKYFAELEDGEKVATLNQESGEIEYQLPTERQIYDNTNGEMYKIEIEERNYDSLSDETKSNNCLVENISILDCSLNSFSSDQIGILNESAKAKYGTSFSCGEILSASAMNSSYSSSEINSISFSITEKVTSNSPCEILADLIIFSLSDLNSSKIKCGENNLQPLFNNSLVKCLLTDSFLKNENNILASTISSFGKDDISSYSPCLLATLFFRPSDNSLICSSVNSDSDIMSSNIANLTSLANCLSALANANSNTVFNSAGTSSLISISAMKDLLSSDYINLMENAGKSGELVVSSEHKIYAKINEEEFRLMPVAEAYQLLEEGKKLYFLDENNNRIKIKSITKIPYDNKIYDVDVENDIVLVRRGGLGATAFWSGNSNNGSVVGDAVQVSNGRFGKGFGFDGGGDYVRVSNPNINFTEGAISTWVKILASPASGAGIAYTGYGYLESEYFGVLTLDGNIRADFDDGDNGCTRQAVTTFGTNYADSSWHYIVVSFNSQDTGRMYIDGNEIGNGVSLSECESEINPSANWILGEANAGYFNGTIDDVMIFNRSLSAEEIWALYANTSIKYLGQNFTSLAEGTHTMKAYVQDMAGNVNTTELRTVAVDFTPMNNWNCTGTAIKDWTNTSCWSRGVVPVLNDSVVFNATGVAPCNITNNSVVQDLNSFTVESGYTGSIHFGPMFAVGSWGTNAVGTQEWNVTNDINISGGTMYVYGDYLLPVNATNLTYGLYNLTDEGHGQIWHSVNGNITVGASGVVDGVGRGFVAKKGKGYALFTPSSHGGFGLYVTNRYDTYGNATAPTSLGSGGDYSGAHGGSAIKLDANVLSVNGIINMSGIIDVHYPPSGGSIWLKGNNITGTGILNAIGGGTPAKLGGGGGGRIRLEYGSGLSYTGRISLDGGTGSNYDYGSAGTLTFTNNTWPGDWNVNGNIGLLGGNYGEGDVVNVRGNFNSSGYNITIYGDCFYNKTNPVTCYNTTADGKGVVLNVSGNISVASGSIIGGMMINSPKLSFGFPARVGPGSYCGGSRTETTSHGGKCLQGTKATYGNETAPISLGSNWGGAAVKLISNDNFVRIDGIVEMRGTIIPSTVSSGGSGGSIWVVAPNILGNGMISVIGGNSSSMNYSSGGGRIALTASNTINFSGLIYGNAINVVNSSSGGTVYINATNSITLTGANISVFGYNGTAPGSTEDWGQRINITAPLLTLSGVINASAVNQSVAGVSNGTITFNFTNCDSSFVGMTTNPNAIFLTQCTPNVTIISPLNDTFTGNATVNFTANVTSVSGIRNVTLSIYNTTGLYNQTTWDYAQGVFSTVVGIPVLMIEGVYTWFFEVWDWANQFVRTDTSTGEGNYTLTVDVSTPNISFVAPTPSDGSTSAGNSIYVNVSADGSAGIGTNISTFVDWDGSLVSWWRMDDVNSSGDVVDYMGCYDNETEILTLQEVDCDGLSEEEINSGEYVVEYYDNDGEIVNEEEIISDKENKEANVAPMVRHILAKDSNGSSNIYINFSNFNNSADEAPVALMVRHQSQKLGSRELPGSNPGWGASAISKKYFAKEWKYFAELNDDERVMTLNQETGEKELQLPTERQIYDNTNGEMYRIETEEGELVVSEEHKIYFKNELDYSSSLRNLNSLPVENISTLVCCLNDSSDHNPQLREIANAKYCKSLSCGEDCLASSANLLKSSNGISSICSFIISKTFENSSEDNLVFATISPKFLPTSVNKYSGAMNSIVLNDLFNRKTSKTVPLDNNAEINLLASTTTNITDYSLIDCRNLLDNALSILSDNSLTSSSVNCDLETIERSLALSCNSLLNNNLINNERLPDSSISISQSLGILTNISAMEELKEKDYKKLSVEGFNLGGVKEVYSDINNGKIKADNLVFLDGNGEEIKVKSITKVPYNNKIYDVDVPNDIVLVRRGELVVWSGNSNNGSVVGDAAQVSNGKIGKGFEFDGDGDYVSVPSSETINFTNSSSFTLSMWVKFDDISSSWGENLLRKGDAVNSYWELRVDSSRRVSFELVTTEWTSALASRTTAGVTSIGPWYHIVAVYNGTGNATGMKIYVNGTTPAISIIVNEPITTISNGYNLKIGRYANLNYNDINGSIDDVMIFNRSLSATEIQALYANTSIKYLEKNFTSLTEGTHTMKAYVQDMAGNVNSTSLRSVSYDATGPVLTVSPLNNSNLNNATVNFTVSLSENSSWCGFSLNETANVSMTRLNDTWFNYTYAALTDGTHNVTFSCNDTVNNLRTSSLNFFSVDTVYPSINLTSPLNATYGNASVLFNVSSSEDGSGFVVPNLDNSLVSWWRMDDLNSSGDVVDYMGRNNGTKSGGAVQVSNGKMGKGMGFDGSGNYPTTEKVIRTDSNVVTGSNFSISSWVYVKNNQIYNSLGISATLTLGAVSGFSLTYRDFGDTDRFYFELGGVNNYASVSDNGCYLSWCNYVLTYASNITNGTASLYINGNLNNVTITPPNIYIDNRISIGKTVMTNDENWNGSIDEVMIFNRSLSSEEIKALYNATRMQFNSNLSEGAHSYRAYTSDVAGNVVSSSSAFAVDSVSPTVALNAPVNESNYNSSSVVVNVTGTDSSTNVSTFVDWDGSLVSWWRMDDVNSSGDVVDYLGRNNGTRINAISTTAGKFGKGFSFDGDGDYVKIGAFNASDNASSITMVVWVKTKKADQVSFVVRKLLGDNDGAFSLGFNSGNRTQVGIVTNIASYNNQYVNYSDGGWHFFAGTYNGSTIGSYWDGVLLGTYGPKTGLINPSTRDLIIGSRDGGEDYYFNGSIDDVMIFNRSLSAEEIAALYANSSAKYLVTNMTSLSDGKHTVKAYAQDMGGNVVSSAKNNLFVDTIIPNISFVGETPNSGFNQTATSVVVNVSSADEKGEHFVVTNFDNSLVGWWRMDDLNSSGDVVDYMGVNNGTKMGGAVQTGAGRFGRGFEFDGVDDRIITQDINEIDVATELSGCAWVYSTSITNDDYIASKYSSSPSNGFLFVRDDFGSGTGRTDMYKLFFDGVNASTYIESATGSSVKDKWIHVCFTYANNSINGLHLYINGLEDANSPANTSGIQTIDSGATLLTIGTHSDESTGPFNGSIDEVMIFNRSLSAGEISALYNATATKYYNNFTSLAEGEHTFKSYAVDLGGNVNATELRTVTIDYTAPNITAITPANETFTSNASVNFSAGLTDIGSGLSNATLYIYNASGLYNSTFVNVIGAPLATTVSVVVYMIEGVYTWFWEVFDVVANTITSQNETTGAGGNYTVTVDVTLPVVNITYPLNTTYTANVTELNYTIADTYVQRCWWSNDSGAWNSTTQSAGVNWSGLNATEGSNTWKVYCNDSANNANSSSVTFSLSTAGAVNGSNSCGTLGEANTTYTLIQDVNSSGTCFIISANNVTLDCNGYNINYSQGGLDSEYGVYATKGYSTVKNCVITDGNETAAISPNQGRHGIFFNGSSSSNGTLLNNNVSVYGNASSGIYLTSSLNNILTNNTATSNSSQGISLDESSSNNTLTSNTGTSTSYHGIFIYSSSNNNLTSNTGTSTSNVGIFIYSASNNNILTNNTGTSTSGQGIYLSASSNNNLTSNTGTSTSSYGIYLRASSNNNLTSNTGTSNSGYGIYLYLSQGNVLNKQTAIGTSTNSRGIAFRDANHTIIQDCVNITGISGDVLYTTTNSTNNTFINCSYRTAGTNETVLAGSELIRKWYYRAFVNDTVGNNISWANITAYNVSGGIEFENLTTNSTGWTNMTTITEYVNNGSRMYRVPYSVNVSAFGYRNGNKSENISLLMNQYKDVFMLTESSAPNITSITPANATFSANQSVNFTAGLTDVGSGLSNATLYIYNASGLYNSTFVSIVGAPLATTVSVVVSMVEGVYTWFWEVFDIANNFITSQNETTGAGENYTVTVDITLPVVNITYPLNTTYSANVTELNYTLTETNIQRCWWSNDSGVWNSTTQSAGVNWSGLNSTEGSNTWKVYCNDSANNVNSSSVTFSLSTTTVGTSISSCGELNESNTTYVLTADVNTTGTCFNVVAENVTLDCAGKTINYSSNGTLGYGVYSNQNFTIVKNCVIKEGTATTSNKYAIYYSGAQNGRVQNNTIITIGLTGTGVYLYTRANNNLVQNNTINATTGNCVYIHDSHNNQVEYNTLNPLGGFFAGVYLSGVSLTSQNSSVIGNIITNNQGSGYGIRMYYAANSNFSSNQINTSKYQSIVVSGSASWGGFNSYNNTITADNLAEGKPINYTYNCNDLIFDGIDFTQYGQVIFGNCNNITIRNSNFSYDGLNLFGTSNSVIDNNFFNGTTGIALYFFGGANNNTVSNNLIASTNEAGAFQISNPNVAENNNRIINNSITSVGGRGLYIQLSKGNFLDGNDITTTGSSVEAIGIDQTSDNTYITNTIFNSTSYYAMYVRRSLDNLTIINSTLISNNSYGIYIYQGGTNMTVADSVINAPNYEIYVTASSNSGTWNLTNVTRTDGTSINTTWITGGVGTLNMHWYLDVNVTDLYSHAPIENANVSLWNSSGAWKFNELTGAGGLISRQTLLEYTRNASTTIYYSPYIVNVSAEGYANYTNDSLNMSGNVWWDVGLSDITAPNITSISPANATFSANATVNFTANLTDVGSGLSNATLYIYNASGLYNSTFVSIVGAPLATTVSVVVSMVEGVYTWFWEVFDVVANTITSQNETTGVGSNYTLTVDLSYPLISFVGDTPASGSNQFATSIVVNVSSSDENEEHYVATNFDNSLVSWYRLDNNGPGENSTKVYDWSGNNNNGTIASTNEYLTTAGKFGGGIYLNGVDDNVNGVDITDSGSLNISGNLTVAAWVKTVDVCAIQGIFARSRVNGNAAGTDYNLIAGEYCGFGFVISNKSKFLRPFTNVVLNNTWYHVVGTWNGTAAKIYLNGVLNKTETDTLFGKISTDSGSDFPKYNSIGGDTYLNRYYFNGTIDEVMIFNRSLSASEISALYNASASKYYNNFTSLTEGEHTFKSYAVDLAGNVNSTEERIVNISTAVADTTAPNLSYGVGTENDYEVVNNASGLYVNVSASDANFQSVVFNLYNNSNGLVNSTMFTDGTRAVNWTGLPAGDYKYNATANDSSGNKNYTTTLNVKIVGSCLGAGCVENGACSITSNCTLYSSLCSNSLCQFRNMTISSRIYTLGNNLALNITTNATRSDLTFLTGNRIDFSGKNGSNISGSLGGNAGVLNITVIDLFNTTSAVFVGRGGYSTISGSGGNGGILQLNYFGLIRNFTLGGASVDLTAGTSANSTSGIAGSYVYNKNLNKATLDVDVTNEGLVNGTDVTFVRSLYNNVSTDSSFVSAYDINKDNKINVADIARIGFEYETR